MSQAFAGRRVIPVGDVESCIRQALQRCTQLPVGPGQRIRRDLEYGVGGGFWH